MVDGGLDYVRYGAVDMDRILPTTVYSDDPFDIVRQSAYRKHLTGIVVRLSQMSDEWLAAAYKWDKERRGCTWHVKLMEKEIKYRAKKKITVTEEEFQKYTGVTPEQTRRIRSVLGDMVRTTPSQSSVREEARKRAAIVSLRSPFRKE